MRNLIKLYYDPAAVIDPPAAAAPAAGDPPVAVTPVVAPAAGDPAASVDLKPASASTTLDINKVDPPKTPDVFVIPDAYKDKPYLKGVDSLEKALAMLDGAQKLIGQKGPTIPKDDAPQEEKDAYYDAIGRPKTPAEYILKDADKTDKDFLTEAQAAMHKRGLSAKQGAELWEDLTGALTKVAERAGTAAKQADIDFDKLAGETFGADRDRVIARGNELIKTHLSPGMKGAIEKLDNNALVVLADVLRNIDKKYIKQDGPGAPPSVNGQTPDQLRAEARGLMADQAKFDSMSPEFQTLQKRIDGIYDTLRRGTK